MGIQWYQLNYKDLLKIVVTLQKPCCWCLQGKKDRELTHAWELNGISSITKTYLKLLHGKNVTNVCAKQKDKELTQ